MFLFFNRDKVRNINSTGKFPRTSNVLLRLSGEEGGVHGQCEGGSAGGEPGLTCGLALPTGKD